MLLLLLLLGPPIRASPHPHANIIKASHQVPPVDPPVTCHTSDVPAGLSTGHETMDRARGF